MQQGQGNKNMKEIEFFTEYGDAYRYQILEAIGKGSYGVVCAAIDTHTGEKAAIKKTNDVFEHILDALCILREVKLLMESDLYQVIKANVDLTQEHHQFFLYQMLRALN